MPLGHDEERFRSLANACHKPLTEYALRRTGDAYLAEEVVSETLLVVWRRRAEIPLCPTERLAWVIGVARWVASNALRGEERRRLLRARLPPVGTVASAEEHWLAGLRARESIGEVESVLRRLSPNELEILRLSVWEDLSHAEIGAILGCSVNAVAIRLHRARASLASRLRENLCVDSDSTEGEHLRRERISPKERRTKGE